MYKRDLQFLFDDCLLHCSIDEAALHRVFDRLLLDDDFAYFYNYRLERDSLEELRNVITETHSTLRSAIIGPRGGHKRHLSASDRDAIFDAYLALKGAKL